MISRLGYDPVHVTDVQITSTSVLPHLAIQLLPDAVQLPGLIVQGEGRERYTEEGEVRSRRGAWIDGDLRYCPLRVVVDGVYRGIYLDDVVTRQDDRGLPWA